MSGVVKSVKFNVQGDALTFAAGMKGGSPVVVFGVRLAGGAFDVATLEIPFPTINDAVAYVEAATEEVAISRREELTGNQDFLKIMMAFSDTERKVTREDLKEKIRLKR